MAGAARAQPLGSGASSASTPRMLAAAPGGRPGSCWSRRSRHSRSSRALVLASSTEGGRRDPERADRLPVLLRRLEAADELRTAGRSRGGPRAPDAGHRQQVVHRVRKVLAQLAAEQSAPHTVARQRHAHAWPSSSASQAREAGRGASARAVAHLGEARHKVAERLAHERKAQRRRTAAVRSRAAQPAKPLEAAAAAPRPAG